ncbi:MAG: beta-lactamase family protein [Clostridia bacterium]|nr:beta-lactamase family protein [Clostridia bacterium]
MKNADAAMLAGLKARAQNIAAGLPPGARSGALLTQEGRAAFSRAAQRILLRERAVGASLVLLHPGGQIQTFCFGRARLSPAVPVSEHTCFRTASVSKLVMTFGALSLYQSGQLSLDADLSDLLGYRVRSPHHPDVPVTLRMLLTHTSGLCDEGNYGTRGMQHGCTLRELLENPANWLGSVPGTAFHYSNLGAGVAGVMMELAAGQPFETIMQERVFEKLAIRASYDPARIHPADDLADGYSVRAFLPPRRKYNAAQLTKKAPQSFDPETDYLIAAGRMITDSDGMGALLRLLAAKKDTPVLSKECLALMRAEQDGRHGVSPMKRGLNTAFLPDVFPGLSPVGHQGVAYGMCAELFADPASGCGVGLMSSGMRLAPCPPLMRGGFDLLALGFAALTTD